MTPARVILSSDGGQEFNPSTHEALRVVVQSLFDSGMPMEVIATICRDNQRWLLGLREGEGAD